MIGARFAFARRNVIGVVTTNTFYAPRCALLAAAQRVPIVHWVFDLYPEVLVRAGAIAPRGVVEGVLRRVVRTTFHRAAANVFLGENLRRHAEDQFGPIPNAYVIPIGADGRPFRDTPPNNSRPTVDGWKRRILYCGNFGRMHEVRTIVDALRSGIPTELLLEFRGNGAGFRELQNELPALPVAGQVTMGTNLGDGDWAEAMKAADVALVTMRRGAEGLVIPSKTYSALVAGQAILAVCPENSDLANLVRRHEAGWVVAPGDVAGLQRILNVIAREDSEVEGCRRRAFTAGHEFYDYRVLAPRWVELLDRVGAGGPNQAVA